MAEHRSVEQLSDREVLDLYHTGLDPATQGFEPPVQARVWAAAEFVRARARVGYYRALYRALLEAETTYVLENLEEHGDEEARLAKLIFTDDPADLAAARPDLATWTEAELLEHLVKERAILDFFAGVLDELVPLAAHDEGAKRR